jgi:hypothetical protein
VVEQEQRARQWIGKAFVPGRAIKILFEVVSIFREDFGREIALRKNISGGAPSRWLM